MLAEQVILFLPKGSIVYVVEPEDLGRVLRKIEVITARHSKIVMDLTYHRNDADVRDEVTVETIVSNCPYLIRTIKED